METYSQMRVRQQKEFDTLPIFAAFRQTDLNDRMKARGLNPKKDRDKIVSIGSGCFMEKKDVPLLKETSKRHREELDKAIAEDSNGEGFVYQMFLYELRNHEYGYTMDPEDTLDELGYTYEEVAADDKLWHGFKLACCKIMREEDGEDE